MNFTVNNNQKHITFTDGSWNTPYYNLRNGSTYTTNLLACNCNTGEISSVAIVMGPSGGSYFLINGKKAAFHINKVFAHKVEYTIPKTGNVIFTEDLAHHFLLKVYKETAERVKTLEHQLKVATAKLDKVKTLKDDHPELMI